MKKWMLALFFLVSLGLLVGCGTKTPTKNTFTVTFDTADGTVIGSQEVSNGGKVLKPSDPTRDGYVFTGVWMNGSFEWNFDLDIVTDDLTLVAGWLEISGTPTNITMSADLFSSTVTWQQTDASLQTFTVSIKPALSSSYTVIDGAIDIDQTNTMNVVTFTPEVIPQGGYYIVKISVGGEDTLSSELLFAGSGVSGNPYLVSKLTDVIALLETASLADKQFKQINDLTSTILDPLEINDSRKVSFSGSYDGDSHHISFTGNGGLFHEILAGGVVKNLIIDSTTTLYASENNVYPIGAVSDSNAGSIMNVTSSALLENARLQGALPVFDTVDTTDLTTGAGGLVGLNLSTGVISEVTVSGSGAVKAGRAIGGVSAYNFGLIEHATVTATLPAGNQANSAKSSNTYSYGGGIAGFNFGTIQYTSVSGRVFAQSAYAAEGNGNEGKNVGFGGIAGYNEGTISDSSFARSLSSKEFISKSRATELGDVVNNLGVGSIHGDMYVGGIAGINAGNISNVYVGGALIAARDYVGGITGLTLGSGYINNAYVYAEVVTKDDGGLVTTANAKTTATTYPIAPNGFDASTTFYQHLLNSETNNNWVCGDTQAPSLPVFSTDDLLVVGNHFNNAGVLTWQTGAVTGVDIVLDNIVLAFGAQQTLDFSVTPAQAPDIFTVWTSSDESVVQILSEGVILGVGEGTATITVTTRDGGFTDTINVSVEDYIHVDTATVTATEITLPTPNDSLVRPEIEIGTVITINVDILPLDAQYQGYTITTSNSRATVSGNQVTFVYGNTGPGNVSVVVTFEDSSVASLEYRFKTIEAVVVPDIPITDVSITAGDFVLPTANDALSSVEVAIDTVVTLTVDILPVDASLPGYVISTSNTNASVVGNVITFQQGAGLGPVSILLTFDDKGVGVNGVLEYHFVTIAGADPVIPITSVEITSPEITLPTVNDSTVRPQIEINTIIHVNVSILPENATGANYTIITSNSRAVANGNEITFVFGSGYGSVSVKVIFEDTTLGLNGVFEYRFSTIAQVVPITYTASVSSTDITLGEANVVTSKALVAIDTTIHFTVTFSPDVPSNATYTLTASNGRATINVDNSVTFNLSTGVGNVSITITFAESSITPIIYYFTTTN